MGNVAPLLGPISDIGNDPALVAAISTIADEGVAPVVRDMKLRVMAAEPGRVRFELDVVPHLVHGGGVLCGQAIMAAMDTGMVLMMASLSNGAEPSFTTVQLATNFERGVPGDSGTVVFEAVATKPGRALVFGEVGLYLPDGRRAASATSTYMWLNA